MKTSPHVLSFMLAQLFGVPPAKSPVPAVHIVTPDGRRLSTHRPTQDAATGEVTITVEVDALVAEPPPLGDFAGIPIGSGGDPVLVMNGDKVTAVSRAEFQAAAGKLLTPTDSALAVMVDICRTAAQRPDTPEPLVTIGQGVRTHHIFP